MIGVLTLDSCSQSDAAVDEHGSVAPYFDRRHSFPYSFTALLHLNSLQG